MSARAALAMAVYCTCVAAAAEPLSVVDDSGQRISLTNPAKRIVTLAPHATELVIAAGAGDALVGIAHGDASIPDAITKLPRISGHGAIDREHLLGLRPDLVVAWQSGNNPRDLDWMAGNGIAVYRSEPDDTDNVATTLRALGELAGTSARANVAAATFENALRTPCATLPAIPVYVEVWDRPAFSVGGRHWLNSVLRRAALRNVMDDYAIGVVAVTAEIRLRHSALPRVSLLRDNAQDTRLASSLARPGPRLAEAVSHLCRWRLRMTPQQAR